MITSHSLRGQFIVALHAVTLFVAASTGALAQQFPTKNITITTSFPATGTPITYLRLITDDISTRTGRTIVVDPKPAAFGSAGLSALQRADADGHSIAFVTTGALLVNPFTIPGLEWRPTSFTAIARVFGTPILLLGDPNIPVKTLADAIRQARDKPESISVATAGALNRITLAQIEAATGAKFLAVPIASPRANIMGGQINLGFDAPSSSKALVLDGKLRAIAMGSLQRSAYMPDVPTIAETVPGVEAATWFGFIGPKGIPADRLAWLHREITTSLQKPAVADKLRESGYDLISESPAQFADYLVKIEPVFDKIIRDYKISN